MNKVSASKIVIIFLITLSSIKLFAGEVVCVYEGVETRLSYHYTGEVEPMLVAPDVLAYTEDCDSITCNLVFESFGQEDAIYNFNKAETIRHRNSEDSGVVECQDSRARSIESDVDEILDSTERAIGKAEDDVRDLGRSIDRGVRSLFD